MYRIKKSVLFTTYTNINRGGSYGLCVIGFSRSVQDCTRRSQRTGGSGALYHRNTCFTSYCGDKYSYFAAAVIYFDKRFLLRSFYGMFALSAATELMSRIHIPISDALLACVFGGAVMGVGIAVVLIGGGTTGRNRYSGNDYQKV